MMKAVSKYQSLKHYKWGDDCDGWDFVNSSSLSVKQERMPAGTSELKHYHTSAQQFFFILKGVADFEIEDAALKIQPGEGLHIEAGKKHRIMNAGPGELEFILCSQPSTSNDRINCREILNNQE
jgi:mannose-6-phosphate isomerase-like protein (cupin superfamily)